MSDTLPPVPEGDWRDFSADRWFRDTTDRINSLSQLQMPSPGMGFLNSSSSLINSLPGLTMPAPPQIPLPQLPTPRPAPTPSPPEPAPAPLPTPTLPTPPPVGLPPSPPTAPLPPGAPPSTEAPPVVGAPIPTVPQVPSVPTLPSSQPTTLPTPPVYAPEPQKPPPQSPFGGEAQGPFAPQTTTTTTTTTTPSGTTSKVQYDPNAPAMQALNAQPAGDLQNYARQAAQKAGIDPEIFAAQIQQESGYNPNAGSPAGAQGVAQIVPRYHPGVNTADPYASLDYAAQLDKKLLDQYGGDWQKALIAYNGGGGAVAAWDSGQPYDESKTYVARILGNSRPNQNQAQGAQPTTQGGLTTGPADQSGRIFPLPVRPDNAPTATYHSQGGSDLMAPRGTPVAAMQSGKVAEVFQDKGDHQFGGNAVLIHGNDGLDYYYAHFDQPTSLKVGDQVTTGQQIGLVGNSGNAYKDGKGETHLHIGIGHGISSGVGSEGGLGEDFNAQALLSSLLNGVPAQGEAPTTAAAPVSATDTLDRMRTTLSNALTSKPAGPAIPPIPRQQMTEFAPLSYPQAEDVTAAPSRTGDYRDLFDTTQARNPLEELGNTIGGAIARALGAAGVGPPGPPPPGNQRRQEDQQQQDQFSTDTGDLGSLQFQPSPDVGTRARQMIEQLQTLPGGMKLGDVVGVPDLLPPDWNKLKNMSVADAIRESIDAAGRSALNLPRPSPGPGGLGIFDPRLGNDPRLNTNMAEGLEELIAGGGGSAARAGEALDEAFAREAALLDPHLNGGIAQDALNALTQTGERVPANTDAYVADAVDRALSRNAFMQKIDPIVRQMFDRGLDMSNITKNLEERFGRPLTDQERLDVLARVDPNRQARSVIDQTLGPAVRGVPQNALERAYRLIGLETDRSANEGQAKIAEREFLQGGIAQSTQRRLDEANAVLDRAQAEHAQALADQRAIDLGVHRTRESASLNAAGQRVRNATTALDDALENARDAAAAHSHESTMRSAQGELVRRPEQRDLIIAQSDARRANARYERLAAREASVPIAPTGQSNAIRRQYEARLASQARQVAYAEERLHQLQLAMGETTATREAAVRGRAATAADVARAPTIEDRDVTVAQARVDQLRQQFDAAVQRYANDPEVLVPLQDRLRSAEQDLAEATARRDTALTEGGLRETTPPSTPELAAARVRLRYEQQNLDRLQAAKARGQQGLDENLARAFQKVNKAQRDVDVATADLPAAARAQGQAVLEGRVSRGPNGEEYHHQDVLNEIQRIRAELEREGSMPAVQNLLDRTQDVRRQMLDEKVDHGIIDDATRQGLLDTYDFHTPRRITDYLTDENGGLARGGRFNVNDPGFKRYSEEGTTKEALNHLVALEQEMYAHKAQIAKNDVSAGIIRGYRNDPSVLKKIADNVKEYVDAGGKGNGRVLEPDYTRKSGEEKIVAMIDGRKQEYITDNKLLKAAIKNIGTGDSGLIRTLLSAPAELVRETAVSRNPAFLPLGIARDAISYALYNMAQGGLKGYPASAAINLGPAVLTAMTTSSDDPNRGQKIAAALALGMGTRLGLGRNLGLGPSAAREWLRALPDAFAGFGSGHMTGQRYNELLQAGAGMGGERGQSYWQQLRRAWTGDTSLLTLERAQQELSRLERRNVFHIRNAGDLGRVINDLLGGGVKGFGQRMEAVPRIATAEMAKQRGASRLERMRQAREVTIDFSRGGLLARELNRYVPFFNVGTQAPAQLARLARRHPGGALAAGMTLLSGPAAATEAWNYSDPQRAQDYEDKPDYMKRIGIVIMHPGEAPRDAQGNRVPQAHFIPIPNEFMPFVEAGREGFHRIAGTGRARNPLQFAEDVGQELSPIGAARNVEAGIGGMIPAGPGTALQLAQNRDYFRGSTIANQFSDENASNLSKGLAPILEDAVTKIPGHSADRIRPSQIDFLIRDLFSGTGQQALNAADALSGRQPRVAGAESETPVIGSLLQRFERGTGGQAWEDVRNPEQMLSADLRRQLRAYGDYWEPSLVPGDIKKIPLRREEQVAYQRLNNQYLDQYLRRVMQNPQFAASGTARDKLRSKAVDAARQQASKEILAQIRASGSSLPERYKQQSSAY